MTTHDTVLMLTATQVATPLTTEQLAEQDSLQLERRTLEHAQRGVAAELVNQSGVGPGRAHQGSQPGRPVERVDPAHALLRFQTERALESDARRIEQRLRKVRARLAELTESNLELRYALLRLGHGVPRDTRVIGFLSGDAMLTDVISGTALATEPGAPLPDGEHLADLLESYREHHHVSEPNQGLHSLRSPA